MATEILYADAVLTNSSGANPENALGAPNGVFTTNADQTNWQTNYSIANPQFPLLTGATHTVTVTLRRSASAGTNPSFSVDLYQGGVLVKNLVPTTTPTSTTGTTYSGTFNTSEISSGAAIEVYFSAVGGGGNPANRRNVQLDAIAVTVETVAPLTGAGTGGTYNFASAGASGVAADVLPNQGTAHGLLSLVGNAYGLAYRSGTASGSRSHTGTATGLFVARAHAAGTRTWTGTASGEAHFRGTATGTSNWNGFSSGYRSPLGSASGNLAYAGSAYGLVAATSTASGTYNYSAAASGKRNPVGSAAGVFTWAGSGLAIRLRDLHVSLGVPTFPWTAEANIRLWNAGAVEPFLWTALTEAFQWEATTPGYRDWTATLTQFEWNAAAEQFKWTAAPPNFD